MLISSSNRPAFTNAARPKPQDASVTLLAPGDAYVPSEPNAFSLGASGTVLGALAGGGLAAVAQTLGLGSTALTVGLAVAGGIGGGFAAVKAFEALQK